MVSLDWCSPHSPGSPHSLVFSGLCSGEFMSCAWVLCVLSHVWLSVTPWSVALQAPLSMGFASARTLEWVAISFFTKSSQLRDWTCISCISHSASIFFTTEPPGKPWSLVLTSLLTICTGQHCLPGPTWILATWLLSFSLVWGLERTGYLQVHLHKESGWNSWLTKTS